MPDIHASRPPRPLPSEPFLRTRLGFDWWMVFALVVTLAFGGLLFGGMSAEFSRQEKFRQQAEIIRICADGTRIYKLDGGYCSWLCRERFNSPDVCQ